MDDYGPVEALMPNRYLWKWQKMPKLTIVQHGHQILPIRRIGGEGRGEGECPAP